MVKGEEVKGECARVSKNGSRGLISSTAQDISWLNRIEPTIHDVVS
jgi:hypothetical protein